MNNRKIPKKLLFQIYLSSYNNKSSFSSFHRFLFVFKILLSAVVSRKFPSDFLKKINNHLFNNNQ